MCSGRPPQPGTVELLSVPSAPSRGSRVGILDTRRTSYISMATMSTTTSTPGAHHSDRRVIIVLSDDLLADIEDVRRSSDGPIPPRSEAIRALLKLGIASHRGEHKRHRNAA